MYFFIEIFPYRFCVTRFFAWKTNAKRYAFLSQPDIKNEQYSDVIGVGVLLVFYDVYLQLCNVSALLLKLVVF